MSNRLTVRHGTNAPTIQHLLPNELGYSLSENVLYIRRQYGEIDEIVPLTYNKPPSSATMISYTLRVNPTDSEFVIDNEALEENVAVLVNLDYTASGLTPLTIDDFRTLDLVDGGEVKDSDGNTISTSIKLKVNGKNSLTSQTSFPLLLMVFK